MTPIATYLLGEGIHFRRVLTNLTVRPIFLTPNKKTSRSLKRLNFANFRRLVLDVG